MLFTKKTTGSENVALGYRAGYELTTGNHNIMLGDHTGSYITFLTTGSQNTIIGNYCRTNASADDNCLVMGYAKAGKGSSTGFICAGSSSGSMYQGSNSSAWATTSDKRLKKNIVDNNVGLDKINQIQVRNFEYRKPDEITELTSSDCIDIQGLQLGVIAQEIQEILPDVVKEESTGVLRVNPDNLTWYLVNAVKDLSAKNDELAARIKALES